MRFARLALAALASNVMPAARPYRIGFSVTDRCNLRCTSCGIWKTTDHEHELSTDEIRRFFANIPFCSWLNLTGGEIFLRPDIADILDAAADIPSLYFLNFTTNGSMPEHTERTIAAVLARRRPVKLVMSVSLDGPQDVHDRLRGKNGAWTNALETYRRLRALSSASFTVYLGMTVRGENTHLYDATVAAADAAIGHVTPRDLHVNFAQVSPHYYRNDDGSCAPFAPDRAYIDGLIRTRGLDIRKPFDAVEKVYLRLYGTFARTGRCPLPCKACDVSCFVDAAGRVYPCVSDGRSIGSLRESGYAIIPLWQSERRRALRGEIAHGRCPQCWTPCEAYQTVGGSLFAALRGLC